MSEYFPETKPLERRMKIELDLSNCNKSRLKKCNRCWYIKFAKKVDLATLRSNVDKLDIDMLKIVPTNLNNLKSKVDKLVVDKLGPVPVEFK